MLLNHKHLYRMKKVLFTIIAAILSITAFAQSEHLTFKGVPIDGTLNQFVTKMKTAGFTGGIDKNGMALLKGDFAGYKGCLIIVSTLQNKDLVNTIGVLFPKCSNWSTLEGNYYKLKEMLTTKYGEPDEEVEEFQHPYSANDDNSRMFELKMDRCNYYTLFRTKKGNLVLKLVTDDYDCHVLLCYYDKINGLEVEAAAMDDL